MAVDDDFVNESNVLCLLQIVAREALLDDKEYKEIIEDIKQECSSHGEVLSIEIPKPENERACHVPGEGNVFVEFAGVEDAKATKNVMDGRMFAGRLVVARFFNPQRYSNKDFV
jgi:splicing factor U2AF subunit